VRETVEFVVDERDEPVQGGRIAAAPCLQQSGDLLRRLFLYGILPPGTEALL